MNPNEDYVTYKPGEETEWTVVVPVHPDSVAEIYQETLSAIQKCYNVFSGFLTPTEVRCMVRSVGSDWTLDELRGMEQSECHGVGVTLSSSDGVSRDEVRSVIQGLDDSTFPQKFVPIIQFKRPKIAVTLADGEYEIGITSSRYQQLDSKENPPSPPLRVEIRTSRYTNPPEISVAVVLNTDIWFEDTKIGEVNRRRLHSFLERLADSLNASKVDYWSNTRAIPFEDLHDR